MGVENPATGQLDDVGKFGQRSIYLQRRYVVAATNDQLFLSADDFQIMGLAVALGNLKEIAGFEEAILCERGTIENAIAEVARENGRPFYQQHSSTARAGNFFSGVYVQQPRAQPVRRAVGPDDLGQPDARKQRRSVIGVGD